MSGESNDAVAYGERFGLGSYEFELVDRIYTSSFKRGRLLRFIAICDVPILVGPLVAAHSFVVAVVVVSLFVVLPGVAGAVLLRRPQSVCVGGILWYADGFVQLTEVQPEPRVIRWQDVIWFSVRVDELDASPFPLITSCTVGDRSGNRVKLPARMGGKLLAEKADRLVAARVVPELVRAFDAGDRVSFGRMAIDHHGITDNGAAQQRFFAWDAIRSIDIDARVDITVHGHRRSREISLNETQNAFFAWHVIEHAAASANVPIRYVREKNMPPRVPLQH
ncbi:MAG TPA: DUF6585 family protein [Pseudonocardiaceae bacterium]|nr:DUF6585 family protein [Pseudonocardiaceae bacterium]